MEKKSRKHFSKTVKDQAVADFIFGVKKTEICKKYGIKALTTLNQWIAAAQEQDSSPTTRSSTTLGAAVSAKEVKDLRVENTKLKLAIGELVFKKLEGKEFFAEL